MEQDGAVGEAAPVVVAQLAPPEDEAMAAALQAQEVDGVEDDDDGGASVFSAATDTDYVPGDPESTAIIALMLNQRFTVQENRDGPVLEELKGLMQKKDDEGKQPYSERFKNKNFEEARWGGKGLVHLAALYGYTEFIKYLVNDCKFSLNLLDNDAESPLHVASENGNTDMVEFILSKNKEWLNEKDTNHKTPLQSAIIIGRFDNAAVLLNAGAIINVEDEHKNHIIDYLFLYPADPEYMEVRAGEEKSRYDTFLDKFFSNPGICAEINRVDPEGLTPLIQAVHGNDIDMIRRIIATGCPDAINFPDKAGRTPLQQACSESSMETLQFLLGVPGVDINKQSSSGKTALHYAAERGDSEVVSELILKDANIGVKNNKNETPLDSIKYAFSDKYIIEIQKDIEKADQKIASLEDILVREEELGQAIRDDSYEYAATKAEERSKRANEQIKELVRIEKDLDFILNPREGRNAEEEVAAGIAELETMFKTANDAEAREIDKPFKDLQQKLAFVLRRLEIIGRNANAYLNTATRHNVRLAQKRATVNRKAVLTILLSVPGEGEKLPAENLKDVIDRIRKSITADPDADLELVEDGVIRDAYIKTVTDESRKQRARLLKLMRGKRDLSNPGEGPEEPSGKRRRTEEGGSRRRERRGGKSKAATAKAAKKRRRGGKKTTYKSKPKAKGRGKLRTVKRRK